MLHRAVFCLRKRVLLLNEGDLFLNKGVLLVNKRDLLLNEGDLLVNKRVLWRQSVVLFRQGRAGWEVFCQKVRTVKDSGGQGFHESWTLQRGRISESCGDDCFRSGLYR
jgi:hypothetical protein